MIRIYTLTGAELLFMEKTTGSLEVGKVADIVVIEKDIRKVPVKEIHKTRPLMTMFAGRMVYRHAEFAEAAKLAK